MLSFYSLATGTSAQEIIVRWPDTVDGERYTAMISQYFYVCAKYQVGISQCTYLWSYYANALLYKIIYSNENQNSPYYL